MVAAARSEASGAAGLPASAIARRPRADPMLTSRDVTAGLCGRPPARGLAGLGLLRCRPGRGRPPGRASTQRRGAGGRGCGTRPGTEPRLRTRVGRSAAAAAPESPRPRPAAPARHEPTGALRPSAARRRPPRTRFALPEAPGFRPQDPQRADRLRSGRAPLRNGAPRGGCAWRRRGVTAKSDRGPNVAVSAQRCSRAWTAAHRAEAFKSGQKSFRNATFRTPPLTELRSRGLLPFLRGSAMLRNGRLKANKSRRQQKRSYFTYSRA